MKNLLIIAEIAAFLLFTSCSPKVYPARRDTVTRVRTEIVEKLVRDTVEVTMPQDSASIVTRDTASTLTIRAAISTATVREGILAHTLYSNPSYKPEVEIIYKDRVEYRDTTVYVDNTEVIEVEKKLSSWQKSMISCGYVLIGALALAFIWFVLKSAKKI